MARLEKAAAERGTRLPARPTLKRNLARWENETCAVSPFYLRLLCDVYGLPVESEQPAGSVRHLAVVA
jgi:hypothetical protein